MRIFTQEDELFREAKGLLDQPSPTPADLAKLQAAIARLHDAIEQANGPRYPYQVLYDRGSRVGITPNGQSFSTINDGIPVISAGTMRGIVEVKAQAQQARRPSERGGRCWIMQQDDGYSPPFQLYST